MNEFWAAIIGAIVGGMISLLTTALFNWQAEIRLRKSRLVTLQFRLSECLTDLHKINQHLLESLTKDGKTVVQKDNFVQHVLELRGGNTALVAIRPTELAILYKKEHDQLVQDISELIRARNIASTMLEEYNVLKHEIDEKMAALGKFQKDGERYRLMADLDVNKDTVLMGKIFKGNDLIDHLFGMLAEVLEEKKNVITDLNAAVRRYFPFWVKTKRLEMVSKLKRG